MTRCNPIDEKRWFILTTMHHSQTDGVSETRVKTILAKQTFSFSFLWDYLNNVGKKRYNQEKVSLLIYLDWKRARVGKTWM